MAKNLVLLLTGAVAGAVIILGVSCLSLKKPEVVVREPTAPGESSLAYTPPPAPRMSLEMVRKNSPMLLTMLRPRMVKVSDDVYAAVGYGFGTVTMVITGQGLVIVDAAVSIDAAKKILADFRKITDQPIRYLIYTHSHQDHTLGSSVFYSAGVKVVATREFLEFENYQDKLLAKYFLRARAIQYGFIEPDYAFKLPISGGPLDFMTQKWPKIVRPNITFDQDYSFELGHKRFELFSAPGETPDHLAVWIPDERTLISGDNYYHSFPNLSTPLLEPRPVRKWIASLGRYLALKPEHLVPGHTMPLNGADLIRERLSNYREAIKYVHDQTVRYINQGKSVDEAVAEIHLPERLAKLDYLQQTYGRVDWSVRGIYRGYTGWYNGNGTGLAPLPRRYRARELVALAGGADKILARAIELQKNGEHQLAAELCDVVIAADPNDKLAHRIKAASMEYLAFAADNFNSFLCYRSAYSLDMKAAGAKPNKNSDAAL